MGKKKDRSIRQMGSPEDLLIPLPPLVNGVLEHRFQKLVAVLDDSKEDIKVKITVDREFEEFAIHDLVVLYENELYLLDIDDGFVFLDGEAQHTCGKWVLKVVPGDVLVPGPDGLVQHSCAVLFYTPSR